MAEVFSAEVTVSIAKYAAEIAKIEAETSKSATKAAAVLVAKLGGAQQKAAQEAVAAAKRSATAWQSAGVANAAFAADAADAAARAKMVGDNLVAGGDAAARSSGRNAAALGQVGHQLSDVASQLSTGTNAFTILIQQGPQIAGALAMAEGGLAGVAAAAAPLMAILGPVAVAAAALGAAYFVLADNLETAEKAMRSNAAAATAMQDAHEEQAEVVAELETRTRVLTGEITKEQAATEKEAAALRASREAMLGLLKARVQETAAALRSTDATWADRQAHVAATATLDAYTRKTDQLVGTLELVAEAEKDAEDAAEAAEEARKRREKALEERSKALQEEAELGAKNAQTYRDAIDAIDGMSFGLKKNKTDVELLSEAYHQNLADIKESEQEALSVAIDGTDAEFTAKRAALLKAVEAREAYYRDIEALRVESEARAQEAADAGLKMRAELQKKQTAIFEQGEADRLAVMVNSQAAAAGIIGGVADAFALAQANMTGLSKKEALVLFRVTQAAQIAQALLLTPAAILQGLAQLGPAGGIAAGIAAGVQVAAIAAAKPPSFRQGTPGYAPPVGEQRITADVGPGEGLAVVSRQGMANSRSEGVAAVNAGLGGGGGTTVVNMVLDGTILGTWIAAGAQTRRGKQAIQGAMSSSFRNPYRST